SRGKPVAGASVTFWQDVENEYAAKPAFYGITDSEGRFILPNRPAPHIMTDRGYTQRDNPFGKINVVGPGDVFFIRIRARGHIEYTWLDVAQFNLAYWSGQEDRAVFTIKASIPPPAAPRPPGGLTVEVNRNAARLWWN